MTTIGPMTDARCPECGHLATAHRRYPDECAPCDDAAQLGTYAPCATVSTEPWTDDDTAELAQAMRDAAWTTADRWSEALTTPADDRAVLRLRVTRPTPGDPYGIAAVCRLTDLMDHYTPGLGRQLKPV